MTYLHCSASLDLSKKDKEAKIRQALAATSCRCYCHLVAVEKTHTDEGKGLFAAALEEAITWTGRAALALALLIPGTRVSAGNTAPFCPLCFLLSSLCCYLAAKRYVLQWKMEGAVQNEMAWHFMPFNKLYKINMNFPAYPSQGAPCSGMLALVFSVDSGISELGTPSSASVWTWCQQGCCSP